MSTVTETQTGRERKGLYIAVAVVVGVLLVIALITDRSAKSTAEAEEKADQLIAAIEESGRTAPDRDQIVGVLGTDGGATCEDPGEALNKAILYSQLTNGAAGPGIRPVISDIRAVQGQLLIIKVYCPDQLDDFQKVVDDLKTDDVIGE